MAISAASWVRVSGPWGRSVSSRDLLPVPNGRRRLRRPYFGSRRTGSVGRGTAQVLDQEGDASGDERCDIGVEEDVLGVRYCHDLRSVAGGP